MVYAHTVNIAVRPGKINIFKHTSGMLFPGKTHAGIRYNPLFRGNRLDFAGQDIPHKSGSQGIKGTAFRGQYIGIISFPDTQRAESVRISGSYELAGRHDDQGIGSFDLPHSAPHRFFCGFGIQPLSCNVIGYDLRVYRCLENSACVCQIPSKFGSVHQISVMRQSQCPLHVIEYQRLCIFSRTAARGGIPHMADADIPLKLFQVLRVKGLVHQPHILNA